MLAPPPRYGGLVNEATACTSLTITVRVPSQKLPFLTEVDPPLRTFPQPSRVIFTLDDLSPQLPLPSHDTFLSYTSSSMLLALL